MKLTKAKYIEFVSKLTGHTKSFVSKNMEINDYIGTFSFIAGSLRYDTWLLGGRIYTQYFLDSSCQGSWYHDFETLDYDWKYTEELERKDFEERIQERLKDLV